MFVGHLGSEKLAAAALGNMFANVTVSTQLPDVTPAHTQRVMPGVLRVLWNGHSLGHTGFAGLWGQEVQTSGGGDPACGLLPVRGDAARGSSLVVYRGTFGVFGTRQGNFAPCWRVRVAAGPGAVACRHVRIPEEVSASAEHCQTYDLDLAGGQSAERFFLLALHIRIGLRVYGYAWFAPTSIHPPTTTTWTQIMLKGFPFCFLRSRRCSNSYNAGPVEPAGFWNGVCQVLQPA